MNIIQFFKQKISIDYAEWRNAKIAEWNIERDNRAIRRAVKRAKIKNKADNKTYYILRDKTGGINELNNYQIKFWKGKGLFTHETLERRIQEAIAIVTSNEVTYKQYNQQQLKKEE